jgi:hypothetical protein
MRTRDAERNQIGLQVVERIVVRRGGGGRIGERMELLQPLREHYARVLRH